MAAVCVCGVWKGYVALVLVIVVVIWIVSLLLLVL